MEDFLREAACMKEFDHHNVMRLLGEETQNISISLDSDSVAPVQGDTFTVVS